MEADCRCLERNGTSQPTSSPGSTHNSGNVKHVGCGVCHDRDSLLPLLLSGPEFVDYKGQTVREAHGSHAGEDEDGDRTRQGELS